MKSGDHITLFGIIQKVTEDDITIKTNSGRILKIDPKDVKTHRPMGKEMRWKEKN